MMCDKDGNDLERERLLEIERKYKAGIELMERAMAACENQECETFKTITTILKIMKGGN